MASKALRGERRSVVDGLVSGPIPGLERVQLVRSGGSGDDPLEPIGEPGHQLDAVQLGKATWWRWQQSDMTGLSELLRDALRMTTEELLSNLLDAASEPKSSGDWVVTAVCAFK
jgi:hypothetical protein